MNTPPDDVRMRGFKSRHTVEDACQWIDSQARAMSAESVALAAAHGRVLAADVVSTMDVPEFDRSAMDGYALHAAETVGAGDYNPVSLRVVGKSLPGQPYVSRVNAGEAIRIMTGAPLPSGADAVVPAEYATEANGLVELTTTVSSLKHVGRRGEDVATGTILLRAGHRLRPQDVGLIASIGAAEVSVVSLPRVRIVITGNELAEPGQPRGNYQIYEANSFILSGLIPRDGGIIEYRVRCPDDRESIAAAISAPGVDVVLISGGSSVGSEDHAPNIVRELGELPIHGIAMRPSSPAGMGRVGTAIVFLLPGNPVSCLCAYDFFAGRAIRLLSGRDPDWPYRSREGTLTSKIVSQIGRVDYCRVRMTGAQIEPIALSGASILSSTTLANGFVVIPAMSEGYAAGTKLMAFEY